MGTYIHTYMQYIDRNALFGCCEGGMVVKDRKPYKSESLKVRYLDENPVTTHVKYCQILGFFDFDKRVNSTRSGAMYRSDSLRMHLLVWQFLTADE
jgi:hypothetical protein